MATRHIHTIDVEKERSILHASPPDQPLWIAGLDEAGRGPLAGPVSIGLAVFDARLLQAGVPEELSGLTDSKKLSEKKREALYPVVQALSAFACAVHVPARLVDRWNINRAIEFGMSRALRRAIYQGIPVSHALLDGNYKFPRLRRVHAGIAVESVIKGDLKVFSIAAASIIAKVSRDRRMQKYAELFPGYGLEKHKGYGTKAHREAIQELGPSPLHRRSFRW